MVNPIDTYNAIMATEDHAQADSQSHRELQERAFREAFAIVKNRLREIRVDLSEFGEPHWYLRFDEAIAEIDKALGGGE